MSSIPRVFTQNKVQIGQTITIEGNDAHHLANVLRIKPGGIVTLCDGDGDEFQASVVCTTKNTVDISISQMASVVHDNNTKVTLYQALIKGDKLDFVVQKAVELGVHRIVPVLCERCVSRPDRQSMAKKIARLGKIAKSAAMQSHRTVVPTIAECISFKQALEEMRQADAAFVCYENEEERTIRDIVAVGQSSVAFLIGPEGGLSYREGEEAREAGIPCVTLGKRILRTETAPLYVLSILDLLLEGI